MCVLIDINGGSNIVSVLAVAIVCSSPGSLSTEREKVGDYRSQPCHLNLYDNFS